LIVDRPKIQNRQTWIIDKLCTYIFSINKLRNIKEDSQRSFLDHIEIIVYYVKLDLKILPFMCYSKVNLNQ
uniref:Ovule protein n=1 Tax=Brugia timori TaxID=42155 RepID=A0A0R3R1N3_9BILA